MERYDLYRFTHADGSSKDWAVRRNADGTVTTRWGPTGPVLPQSGTRPGDKIALERAKRNKGYVAIGPVGIDPEGRVHALDQNPATDSTSEPPKEALYWRIRIGRSVPREPLLAWGHAVSEAADRLAAALGCRRSDRADFEPGVIGDWRIPGTHEAGAGPIPLAQGVVPLLVMMTLKQLAPDGVTVSIATEDSLEIGTDLRTETPVLAQFGIDLESVRPMAEALGLLQPRIDLTEAIQSDQECWF
ncbi:hypothetical protein EVC37_21445 [Methylocaldum sp. BRCS4]|jgi:hypothetical protein|nr:hypothetical protein [Methylocaldum sp. BRCS4]